MHINVGQLFVDDSALYACGRWRKPGGSSVELRHSIDIQASPDTLYDWFRHLDRHYRQWHADHRDCYWEKGDGTHAGDILFASELLHGRLHRLRFRMTRLRPGRFMRFRVLGVIGWLVPEGDFTITPSNNGSRFSAGLRVRGGWLLRRLLPAHYQALRTHMREEGENLKRLLELS